MSESSSRAGGQRAWDFTKHYQFIGGHGILRRRLRPVNGCGRGARERKYGRLTVISRMESQLCAGRVVDSRASQNSTAERDANNRSYHQGGCSSPTWRRAQRGVNK